MKEELYGYSLEFKSQHFAYSYIQSSLLLKYRMRQEEDRFLEEENEQTFIDNAAVEHYISILLTTYKVLLSPILQRRN